MAQDSPGTASPVSHLSLGLDQVTGMEDRLKDVEDMKNEKGKRLDALERATGVKPKKTKGTAGNY